MWSLSTYPAPPFEPLKDSSDENLLSKTCFLVAFATAARVGEVHALDVTTVKFKKSYPASATVGVLMNFIAKNQSTNPGSRTFTIPSMENITAPEDSQDRLLCPVRALKIYISRTKAYRGDRKRLFIPADRNYKGDINKNRVAFWLRSVIINAYSAAGLPVPQKSNPLEIRAVSASLALHKNISVQDIVKGCFWSSQSIFASHYLRDFAVQDIDGINSLGPIVCAQQLTT